MGSPDIASARCGVIWSRSCEFSFSSQSPTTTVSCEIAIFLAKKVVASPANVRPPFVVRYTLTTRYSAATMSHATATTP